MIRTELSKILFGSKIKLIPQGKTYTVKRIGKAWRTIILADDKGNEIEKGYNISVYLLN